MEATDYLRKATRHLLNKKKMKQKTLAAKIGQKPQQLCDFLNGRRNYYKEEVREKIAKALGTTYVDMMQLGRELAESEQPLKPIKNAVPLPHKELINQFQDKDAAREINQMLVALERHDLEKYKQARTYVQALYDTLIEKKISNG